METYSQLKQDLNVLKTLNEKKNGYFIDIGASNGINLSNTYLLEKDYEWKGICIEPLPEEFELLKINRPKSICINKAVYNTSNQIVSFAISNVDTMYSGIADCIDCHIEKVNSDKQLINVQTITLNDILEQNNAPNYIDYLSIDTEGSEFEIIKSVDLKKYIFGIIDIEHNFIEPRRTNIRDFLLLNGYLLNFENEWDDSYIHSSLNK